MISLSYDVQKTLQTEINRLVDEELDITPVRIFIEGIPVDWETCVREGGEIEVHITIDGIKNAMQYVKQPSSLGRLSNQAA